MNKLVIERVSLKGTCCFTNNNTHTEKTKTQSALHKLNELKVCGLEHKKQQILLKMEKNPTWPKAQ